MHRQICQSFNGRRTRKAKTIEPSKQTERNANAGFVSLNVVLGNIPIQNQGLFDFPYFLKEFYINVTTRVYKDDCNV
ncbi:uncharacterized protein ASCRUDRAFT_79341 [Ascoidea rubescens DSM 1968]|uniref:Uncharacterized protein n=1 Tax=Ascoidea rubescens DSM 1968 TaxID=1344418 RepID=A0A1D2VSF5_9ASCO|nr:hypothetical protein ASCRUDRAFT_79341 [Ascoidea rubescens DSM 1968]ODV64536.1 hypothetical protein ASCRUDRAFT_79341 [Ascoidea rubescens DSM 1968]